MSRQSSDRRLLREEREGPCFFDRLLERNDGVEPWTFSEVLDVCERVTAGRVLGPAEEKRRVPKRPHSGTAWNTERYEQSAAPEGAMQQVYARILPLNTTTNISERPPTQSPEEGHVSERPPTPFPEECFPSERPPTPFPEEGYPSGRPPTLFPEESYPSERPPTPFPEECYPLSSPIPDSPVKSELGSQVLDEFDREANELLACYTSLLDGTTHAADVLGRADSPQQVWDAREETDGRIQALREAEAKERAAREREERMRALVMKRRQRGRENGNWRSSRH